MSALHYSEQGLTIPMGNPLCDAKSLSRLYSAITPYQWPAFDCVVTIRLWIEAAPDLLKEEAGTSEVKGGGWSPRKDSILDKIIREALDENAPSDSLWRFIYLQYKDLKPVIIFGVISAHFKRPKKSKWNNPRPDPEEEANSWQTTAKKFLVKMFMEAKVLPDRITLWLNWKSEQIRKKGEDISEPESSPSKRRRIESSEHGDSPSQTRQLPDPAQESARDSYMQHNPQAQPYHNGELDEAGYERFKLSVAELNECLLYVLASDRTCHVEKLGLSPESTVRVDPLGKKSGIFWTFRGQTAKNLAKRAVPATTSKALQYSLPFTNVCDHILDLVECKEEEFDMVYCQGFATLVISPDYEFVTFLTGFMKIKAYVKQARGLT